MEISIGEFARSSRLSLKALRLGVRTTYLATPGMTAAIVPDDYCDLAVPFAFER